MLRTHQSGALKWVLFIAVSLLLAKLIIKNISLKGTDFLISHFVIDMINWTSYCTILGNHARNFKLFLRYTPADLKLVAQLLPELYSTESNYHY